VRDVPGVVKSSNVLWEKITLPESTRIGESVRTIQVFSLKSTLPPKMETGDCTRVTQANSLAVKFPPTEVMLREESVINIVELPTMEILPKAILTGVFVRVVSVLWESPKFPPSTETRESNQVAIVLSAMLTSPPTVKLEVAKCNSTSSDVEKTPLRTETELSTTLISASSLTLNVPPSTLMKEFVKSSATLSL